MDDARTEYSQQRSRLQATAAEAEREMPLPEASSSYEAPASAHSFGQWFQMGLAFTLPLIIFALVAFAIFFWMTGRGR